MVEAILFPISTPTKDKNEGSIYNMKTICNWEKFSQFIEEQLKQWSSSKLNNILSN